MEYVAWFEEIDKNSLKLAGGKGANLGEMVKLGLPVPEGFVITTKAYEKFLEVNKLKDLIHRLIKACNVENTEQLLKTSQQIKDLIVAQDVPNEIEKEILESYEMLGKPFVAVRSSATAEDLPTASFAGQQATFLNVKGEKELIKAVKRCWASLFEPRAIFYRRKHGIEEASIAVIVQKMVNSESSGVMFTLHPVTSEEKIVIEAIYGLGEYIVGGKVVPDHYEVDKRSMKIEKITVERKDVMLIRNEEGKNVEVKVPEEKANAQVLNEDQIIELAKYGVILEEHYKAPQDVEFAVENGKVYIVQTRNITTRKKIEEIKVDKSPILEGLGASPGIAVGKVKIVHNFEDIVKVEKGDILVTPMTSPDLVPTMSKCAAIITDKGGATCLAPETLLLTPNGFLDAKSLYDKFLKGEKIFILSYDFKEKKPRWKKVINAFKRKAKVIEVQVSQKMNNLIRVTPDHKFFTFKDHKIVKKKLEEIIEKGLMVCSPLALPEFEIKISNPELSYLLGVFLSNCYCRNVSAERVKFESIDAVNSSFENIFGYSLKVKEKVGSVGMKKFAGECTYIYSTLNFEKIYNYLETWSLLFDEKSSLYFLVGFIDGSGTFNDDRIQLYVYDEKVLKALVITCLKLGILPKIIENDGIFKVQLSERVEEILKVCKRVKGKIKTLSNSKLKKELEEVPKLNFRMLRVKSRKRVYETEVFNFEVDAKMEMEKNYVIFSSQFTPILVSNCHAAIVSRELGIPCIVGTKNATQILKDGMLITVDAYSGKIYEGEVKIERKEEEFTEKTKTKIKVNLAFAEKAEEAAKKADGVGLLRIEHAILKAGKHPAWLVKEKPGEYEKILVDLIKPIAKAFYPKKVWVRSLDARSDELMHLEGADKLLEPNPMLGWHGIRRSLDEPEILKAEMRALKHLYDEGLDNIEFMLPFIVNVEEFERAKEIAKEIFPELKIGIMVETPAAALNIEEFCKAGISFASIGSNDLTMLTLGADRNNERVAKIYNEFHPSVVKQIEHVIKVCDKYNVESSICGEAGSDPEFAKILVKKGIKSISVNLDAINKIRKVVWEAEQELV